MEKRIEEEERKRKRERRFQTLLGYLTHYQVILAMDMFKRKGFRIRLHLRIIWFLPRIRSKKINGLWTVYTTIGPQTELK